MIPTLVSINLNCETVPSLLSSGAIVFVFSSCMISCLICLAAVAMWLQRAEKHFSHTDSRTLQTVTKPNETLPKCSSRLFHLGIRVFFVLFSFFYPALCFFFSSLLGPELLTSGSTAWCFLAAVKFHRSQPSAADTIFFFKSRKYSCTVRQWAWRGSDLVTLHQGAARRHRLGGKLCRVDNEANICARNKHNGSVQHLSWTKTRRLKRASWLSLNILFANKRVITQKS